MMDEKRMKHRPRTGRGIAMISILAVMILLVMGVFAACAGEYPDEGSAEAQLRSQLADADVQEVTVNGTLYLHGPVAVSGTKILKGNGVLKAVGHWSGTEQAYVLVLGEGADITLAESFAINGNAVSGGVYVSAGAKLTVTEQAVVKNAAEAQSNVMSLGSVNMTGGELKDSNGHNLYISGEAVVSGGVVSGSGEHYAGVYNAGKLEMTGGELKGAYDNVYVAEGGSFLWNGGKNLSAVNDGICVAEGGCLNVTSLECYMEGAGKQGIHLYGETNVDDVFLVGSGENNIKIEQSGIMTMVNGAIDGSLGHGITNRGTLIMQGGDITNSKACGILTTGKLEVYSGSIFGSGNQGILVRNGGHAVIKGSTLSVSSNNMGISVEENAYAEVTECNVNTNSVYNFYSAGELYLHDLTTGGSGSNCIATNYGGHILAENITINGTSRNNGIYNINGSLIELKNVTIDKTKTNGIRNLDAHLVAENLTITNCGREGLSIGDYIYQGAGSVKINGLTTSGMAGSNMAVDIGCTGTIEISNAKLGMSGTNNLKIQGGNVILTNVELLGNQPGGNSTHGILMDEGAKVTATNLLICDTVASGIRNRGGEFVGEKVTMRNLGVDGISNVPHGTTKNPGNVTIRDLTTSGVTGTNVKSECPGGKITLTNATLGKCGTNSVRVNRGTVVLNNVVIQGHGAVTKSNSEHGIFIDGGDAVVNSVTIRDTKAAGIRHKGGVLTGSNVTIINAGGDGISCSEGIVGGTLTINGLTVNGSAATNVFNDGPNTVNITKGKLGPTVTNNVRVINGVVNLTDVEILGQTENPKEGNQHGIFIDNGKLNLDAVTVRDTDAAGVRISGGAVSVKDSTLQDTGSNGVYQSGGELTLNGLTVKNNKGDAIGISAGTITGTSVTVVGTPGCGINQSGGIVDIETVDLTGTGTNNGGVKVDAGSFEADTLNIKTFRDGIIVNGGSFAVTKGGTFQGLTRNGMGIGGDVQVKLTGVTVSGFTGTDYAHAGVNAWNEKAQVELTDCTIDGAKDAVYLTNGSVTMNGGKIINSTQEAVEMNGGSFTSNNTEINKARDAFCINGGTANISGGTVCVSRNGVSVGGEGTISLTSVTIDQPGQSGINMWKAGTVTLTDTTITGSGKEGIILSAGTVTVNGNSTVTGSKKTGVQNNGGTVVLNGGHIYGNASGDVNNSGSLTIGKVTVGYDAEGNAHGGKITSTEMIHFSGDSMSQIHASGKKLALDIGGNASNTKLVAFESNDIALALQNSFEAGGKNLAVADKVLYIIEPLAEVDGKEYASLSSAIEAAQKDGSSGVIKLLKDVTVDETYTISGNVTITGAKTITRSTRVKLFDIVSGGSLTLSGNLTVTDGQTKTFNVINVAEGAALNVTNVTFRKLYSANNADAVICANAGSSVTMDGVVFTETQGMTLGLLGAAKDGTVFTFANCTFEKTNAPGAWGGVLSAAGNAAATFTGCTFTDNTAKAGGVACISGANVTFTDCAFSGNKGINQAGVIYVEDKNGDGIVTITGGSFENNTAGNNSDKTGGTIYAKAGAQVDITGTTFTGNKGKWGGTIYTSGATLNVTNASFTGNDANGTQGAAIFAEASSIVNVSGSTFSGNAAAKGKDIYVKDAASSLTVRGVTKTEEIYLNAADTVSIPEALGDGAVLVFNAPKGTVVQFKDGAALENGVSKISLTEALQQTCHFQYDAAKATATIAEGQADPVAQIGIFGYNTLADAVTAAENGDTITLIKDAVVDSTIIVNETLTITDNGTAKTIVRGNEFTGAMFSVSDGSLTLKATSQNNITVDGRNVSAANPAIAAGQNGTLVIDGVKFTGNVSTGVGSAINANGAYQNQAKLTVRNATFEGNQATGEGTVYMRHCTAEFNNCLFRNNQSAANGGALSLHDYTTVTVNDSAFTKNSANYGGAIIMASDANAGYGLTLSGCTFTENSATYGGGLYAWKESGLTMDGCSFSDNTASGTPAGSDVHFRMNGSDAKESLTVRATAKPMVADIYIQTGCMNKVFVAGTLADGSCVTFNWSDPQSLYNLTFDSAEAAQANFDNVTLAAALTESYHLVYSENIAKLTAGKDDSVAYIGYTGYAILADAVAAAQADGKTVKLVADVTLDATISVTGTVTITDDGTARTITRGSSFTGILFDVTGGGSLTFASTGKADVKDGKATGNASKLTIDGNGGNVTGAEAAVVATSSHVTVGQGVRFTNFKNASGKAVVQIHKDGGSLTINSGVFDSNTVTGYCGTIAVWNNNPVNISNAVFKDNTCTNKTGSAALYLNCKKTCEVGSCVFDNNNGYNGGAVNIAGTTTVTFTGCTFKNNINNGRRGSSIYVDKGGSQVTINGCSFEGNEKESITVHNSGARTVTVNGTVITKSGAWAAKTDAELMAIVQEVQ